MQSESDPASYVSYGLIGLEVLFWPVRAAQRIALGNDVSFHRSLKFGIVCISLCAAYALPLVTSHSSNKLVAFADHFGVIIGSVIFGILLWPVLVVMSGQKISFRDFIHVYSYSFVFDVIDVLLAHIQHLTELETELLINGRVIFTSAWTVLSLSLLLSSVFSISAWRALVSIFIGLCLVFLLVHLIGVYLLK